MNYSLFVAVALWPCCWSGSQCWCCGCCDTVTNTDIDTVDDGDADATSDAASVEPCASRGLRHLGTASIQTPNSKSVGHSLVLCSCGGQCQYGTRLPGCLLTVSRIVKSRPSILCLLFTVLFARVAVYISNKHSAVNYLCIPDKLEIITRNGFS